MIDYQLKGKVAIVTGGVSGIGLAAAELLAASGAAVAVWDLKEEAVQKTAEALRGKGVKAIGIALDVTDEAAVEAAVQRTVQELGGLDIAVNNAGIGGPSAASGDYPVDGWKRVIDINLTNVFLCQRAQIQAMRSSGKGGSIINMASILGQVGFDNSAAYVAAKHGVVGLTQTAAWEHAGDRIRSMRSAPASSPPTAAEDGPDGQESAGKQALTGPPGSAGRSCRTGGVAGQRRCLVRNRHLLRH